MNTNTQHAQPTKTQERLYLTAVDLFAEQGYQNTSLRDLAARLGIGAGSSTTTLKVNRRCSSTSSRNA